MKTDSLTGFNGTSAKCGGTLTDSSKACNTPVLQRRVCYSITPKPTITSTITSDGTGTGTFTSKLENLIAEKTYFVRAYALTPTDTIYGNERILKTKYAVGDTAQGGIVFYVDKTGFHGMVYPMPKELSSFKAEWTIELTIADYAKYYRSGFMFPPTLLLALALPIQKLS